MTIRSTPDKARVLASDNLSPALDALKKGLLVAIPTETVYGLAGNAESIESVAKIFAAKDRPTFDPLIVHVSPKLHTLESLAKAQLIDFEKISPHSQKILARLLNEFWPGPLTVLFPKGRKIPDLVTSGLETVAIRMPAHPVAQRLLNELDFPLAAPSANRFGKISPTKASHVLEELGDRISYVIDGGDCEIGIESTVIRVVDQGIDILRPGKISLASIELAIQKADPNGLSKNFRINYVNQHLDTAAPAAPGMLAQHYSPRKPMFISREGKHSEDLHALATTEKQSKVSILLAQKGDDFLKLAANLFNIGEVLSLSASGDSIEAARNLFSHMRLLDDNTDKLIIAELPNTNFGLWHAVKDRMRRASTTLQNKGLSR